MSSSLIACLCLALAAISDGDRRAPPAKTTTLIVSVGDAANGAFVADAEVKLTTIKRSARTKWDGEVRFHEIEAGRYHIQVRAIGYAPGDVDAVVSGDSMGVHFALERVAPTLDTVRVEATRVALRLAEFEARRREGLGRFLTDSMLREDRTRSLQTVLVTQVPGMTMKYNSVISMQPSGLGGDNECPVLFYYDGMQMESVDRLPVGAGAPGGNGRGGGRAAPPAKERTYPALDRIRPEELVGVEVYSRTMAPQQYRPLGNYCKVVLLWSRY